MHKQTYTKIAPRNRSKKQRTVSNNNRLLALFIALAAFVTLGLAGHSDYQYAQLQQASNVCQAQLYAGTFDNCINNQLEQMK